MAQPGHSEDEEESWLSDFELGATVVSFGPTVARRARRKRDGMAVLLETPRVGIRKPEWARSALERQRRILGEIDHPALPPVIDVVHHPGRLALVFPDHGGYRLDAVLARLGKLSPDATLALGIELSDALAALHRGGHAHGLLRPQLVELTENGQIYLHGAGRLPAGAEQGQDELLELPEHMAPEMILGDEPDPIADLFLFGMLMHHCLTGAHPFAGDEAGISQRVRHAAAPSARHEVPETPPGLDRLLRRCLRKRRRDRPPDMTAVGSELVQVLRHRTSLPRRLLVGRALAAAGLGSEPPPPAEPHLDRGGAPPWARRAGVVGGSALLAGALLILGYRACEPDDPATTDPRGIIGHPAQLRLLAHPWAEIHIDGKLIDVTPIGQPVEVTPGPHEVRFKHPHARDEVRTVEIIPGQTIVLEVEMQIERPADAGVPDASAEDLSP